jgi:hypothetical protein
MEQQASHDATVSPTRRTRPSSRTNITRGSELPEWDSFPLLDRHLLIGLIVQTARRQLPPGAMPRSGLERR